MITAEYVRSLPRINVVKDRRGKMLNKIMDMHYNGCDYIVLGYPLLTEDVEYYQQLGFKVTINSEFRYTEISWRKDD